MHVALIHNPDAGGGTMPSELLRSTVARAGHRVESWRSSEPDWREALRDGYDLIVAAGGDGTAHKVFLAAADGSTPVSIVPLGTANNIARTLGFDINEPLRVVDGWATSAVVDFDLPTVRANDRTRFMIEGVTGGLLAGLLAQADDRYPNGPSREELWTLFREMLGDPPSDWSIRVDGHDHSTTAYGVHVLNVRYAGPAIPMTAAGDPSDGTVEVVVIEPSHLEAFERYGRDRQRHQFPAAPKFTVLTGRHIEVTARAAAPIAIDDDLVSTRQLVIDVGVRSVPVLRPRERSGDHAPNPTTDQGR